MPSIKQFAGDRSKLKGFLTQVKIQIDNEGLRLLTPIEKIVYAGMYLTGKSFKQFQPYLAEMQVNKITLANKEVRYVFSLQEGFYNRLTQMYRDAKEEKTVTRKLYKLKQTLLAIVYITKFQLLSV